MDNTWIDFSVACDSIGINQVLEALSEFVGSVERWRCFSCRDIVQN